MVLRNGNDYYILIIPPLVILGTWLLAIYHANNHPAVRHAYEIRHLNPPGRFGPATGAADQSGGPDPLAGHVLPPGPQPAEPPSARQPPAPAHDDRTGSAYRP